MNELFARRFHELAAQKDGLTFYRDQFQSLIASNSEWRGWATSVQNLLKAVYGDGSDYYNNFSTAYKTATEYEVSIQRMFHIFNSAKTDFEGGFVFNVELRVSGEVFGDFVALARKSLDEGYKDVAAVLACAALEDALKRYAAANKLDVEGKTMADIINALKSAALVAGAQKTMLDRMPTIRNYALHANWEKISEPDVGGAIGFVEQFLLTKFS